MSGGSGIVTLQLDASLEQTIDFVAALEIFSLAESLGGIESLIGYPFLMSHGAFPRDEKLRKGIAENTVRLSVGIENVDDLCDDLGRALDRAAGAA